MATEQQKDGLVLIAKSGELLACLDDGVLYTVDLHCDEAAIVWYSLMALAV